MHAKFIFPLMLIRELPSVTIPHKSNNNNKQQTTQDVSLHRNMVNKFNERKISMARTAINQKRSKCFNENNKKSSERECEWMGMS